MTSLSVGPYSQEVAPFSDFIYAAREYMKKNCTCYEKNPIH